MLPPIFEVKIDLGLFLLYSNEIYVPLENCRNTGYIYSVRKSKTALKSSEKITQFFRFIPEKYIGI